MEADSANLQQIAEIGGRCRKLFLIEFNFGLWRKCVNFASVCKKRVSHRDLARTPDNFNQADMKRLTLIIAVLSFLVTTVWAKGTATASFSEYSHDFGTIEAKGGKVTAVYTVENTGDEELVILSVTNGGCGCTTPSYTKKPIAPGAKGEVKLTFDPSRFSGEFNRSVTVTTNGKPRKTKLKFSGYIKP